MVEDCPKKVVSDRFFVGAYLRVDSDTRRAMEAAIKSSSAMNSFSGIPDIIQRHKFDSGSIPDLVDCRKKSRPAAGGSLGSGLEILLSPFIECAKGLGMVFGGLAVILFDAESYKK